MECEIRSWLVQRLERPFKDVKAPAPSSKYRDALLAGGDVPAEFTAMRGGILRFDYMGSSEFEFGAIPRALHEMARTASAFKSTTITIPKGEIDRGMRGASGPTRDGMVYLLARPEHRAHAEALIRETARDRFKPRLKEIPYLGRALCEGDEAHTAGWLELDNLFWFFTDKRMHDGVKMLFGIA